jgi:hypothetical protein
MKIIKLTGYQRPLWKRNNFRLGWTLRRGHISGSQSSTSQRGGPGSSPGQVMWDLWWTKRHWGRFSPSTSVFPTNYNSTECSTLIICHPGLGSRDSSVGIPTGYGLDEQGGGSSSPGRVNNFHCSISSIPALGSTQPPINWVPGGSFPGVKRQGREADQLSPTSAEVKKMWIYTSTPPYVFVA